MSATSSASPIALKFFVSILQKQADAMLHEGNQLTGDLDTLTATCREYALGDIGSLGYRVKSLQQRNTGFAEWANLIASQFVLADSGSSFTCPINQNPKQDQMALWLSQMGTSITHIPTEAREGLQVVATNVPVGVKAIFNDGGSAVWNAVALHMLTSLQSINVTESITQMADELAFLIGDTLMMGGLIFIGSGRIPMPPSPSIISNLYIIRENLRVLDEGFWNLAFHKVDPTILIPLAEEIEKLNLRIHAEFNLGPHVRPPKYQEYNLEIKDYFPSAKLNPNTGKMTVPIWNLMLGNHSAISPYTNEQLTMMQVGAHDYVFAICGLDINNMHTSPNGVSSVMRTAYDPKTTHNSYYQLIKTEFKTYLDHIPPGSVLHLSGHSMGGGMTMLLINDPEIQSILLANGYTIASITTIGAVRPENPKTNGFPPTEPTPEVLTLLENTRIATFVDNKDLLSLNVGTGHMDEHGNPLPNVYMISDWHDNSPVAAHTGYHYVFKYLLLPSELQDLPFEVDPSCFKVFRHPDDLPVLIQTEPDAVLASAALH